MPRCIKKIVNTNVPPTLEESYVLESRNNEIPPPLKKPSHMVIVDDCHGTDMYILARRDLMNHTTIKLNATHFIIYKTGDLKQLKQIFENFATYVTF